jgi:YbgC/YbaW family acyl-CoA thioester hydrolase
MTSLSARVQVRTYELDSFGHVNNSVYLNYFEEARAQYLSALGLDFHDFARLGVQLVIVEAHVRYLASARAGDTLDLIGSFRDVKAATLAIDYLVIDTRDNRTIATGWTRGAFVDAATGRPIRAPEPFASAFRSAV